MALTRMDLFKSYSQMFYTCNSLTELFHTIMVITGIKKITPSVSMKKLNGPKHHMYMRKKCYYSIPIFYKEDMDYCVQ